MHIPWFHTGRLGTVNHTLDSLIIYFPELEDWLVKILNLKKKAFLILQYSRSNHYVKDLSKPCLWAELLQGILYVNGYYLHLMDFPLLYSQLYIGRYNKFIY